MGARILVIALVQMRRNCARDVSRGRRGEGADEDESFDDVQDTKADGSRVIVDRG